ncbi:MAG: general secretion pathway protein GspK [Opitutaceae bacterium]|nr:general secretion pathway protein GspK [Opitutaceae bacterium]
MSPVPSIPSGPASRPRVTPGRRWPRRPTAGSVILLVLVTVLLAAFLLTKFVSRAGTELLADARAGDQARLRREAYSALEVTLAVLADMRAIDNGLFSPAQGWDDPLAYAGYEPPEGTRIEVGFEDESGKISLPRADPVLLESIFGLLGVGAAEAEKATDALLVWTRTDYAPTSLDLDGSNYERAELPHNAAHRPLRSYAELASVEVVRDLLFDENGRPNALAREFAANVSLYSFGQTNLNAASPAVLLAAGLVDGQVQALRDFRLRDRQGGGLGFFRSAGDAAAVLGGNAPLQGLGAEIRALRVNVTVREGLASYRLSAVVAPPNGASVAEAAPEAAARAQANAATAGSAPSAAETAVPDIKKLDYPFKVLEIREDAESPAPLPESSN